MHKCLSVALQFFKNESFTTYKSCTDFAIEGDRDRRADVPPALGDVIAKCLARDPKDRYPDATSMRRALKPFC